MAIIDGDAGNNTLNGTELDDVINGLGGNDTLNGLGGNDTLDGGTGNDSMAGGTGDDAYVVDSFSDTVVENPGEGTDTVNTTLSSYSPGANVENVTFTGTGAFSSTGNDLNNRLQGGAGNDNLNGLGGNDTLVGRAGDDMYSVDSIGDVVTELSGEGTDQVWARLSSYTLPDHVEILVANTVGNFTGTGNGLANIVAGLDGNDNLDEVAAESTNGAGADANVFLALLGGGADTLDFTGTGWTQTASLQNVAAGAMLPSGAVRLSTAEAAIVNAIWGSQAIDPATGLGTAVGLDLYVFAKGAQIVTVWTDADTVI